jgi:hypothetical protein
MSRWILAGALGALLVLALLAGDGAGAARYEAERTTRTQIEQAERTQREAIQQEGQTQRMEIAEANRTERTYISAQQLMWLATEREATLRLLIVLLIAIVASVAGLIVAVLVLRQRPAAPRPAPPDAVRRVAAWPAHRLEYDPVEGWIVVLPGGREFYTEEDARRLEVHFAPTEQPRS